MSQVSYGTITITDTTDLTTYIRYAKKIGTGMIESDFQETPTTDTHYIAVLNIPSSDSIPTWNSDKWKWSEFVGTDGVSVLGTREIYYLKTNSSTVTAPSNGSDIAQTSEQVENQWTKSVPTYKANGEYWSCIQTHLDGSPTWVYSVPILNQALTDMNYNAAVANSIAQHANEDAQGAMSQATATQIAQEALSHSLRKIWINETTNGTYLAGTYAASGLTDGVDSGFKTNDPSTYGFNSLLRHTYLSFRYNTHQLVTIGTGITTDTDGISGIAINTPIVNSSNQVINVAKGLELTNNVLNFYHAPTISDSTVTDGTLAMQLTTDALNFYGSSTSEADAILNVNGLKLSKGGIESGGLSPENGYGYVYLSTEDKTGITINGHNPETNDPKWRAIIGSKFGVDADGNLYASNANISGAITATSLTIANGASVSGVVVPSQIANMATQTDVGDAEAKASYSLEIKVTAIDYAANTATLVAIPYYQGSITIPSGVTLIYTWYRDSISSSNIVGSNSNTLNVTNTNTMGLEYNYICVISKS